MFRQIVKMGKVKKISFHFEYPINTKLTLLPTEDTDILKQKKQAFRYLVVMMNLKNVFLTVFSRMRKMRKKSDKRI